MNEHLAVPFIAGALSLLLSDCVQKLLSHNLLRDHQSAIHDGTGNQYVLPPRLDETPSIRRFSRDADALGAVAFASSTLSAALVLFEVKSVLFALSVGVAVLLPVAALAVLLRIEPQEYDDASWFRNSRFPISPLIYWAIPISLVVGLLAALFGAEA
jgi:hypothetical protein